MAWLNGARPLSTIDNGRPVAGSKTIAQKQPAEAPSAQLETAISAFNLALLPR